MSRLWFRLLTIALLSTLVADPAAAEEPGFRSMFNGKDLTGWDAEPGLWRVKDGCIEGGHPDGGPVASSSFLIWQEGGKDAFVKDFHMKAQFWIGENNSGVQYRSTRLHPKYFHVGGYQAEISNGFATGFLYHQNHNGPNVSLCDSVVNEAGKGVVYGQVADQRWMYQKKFYAKEEWGRYDIICRGNHNTHFVNGYPTVEFIDRDEKTADRKRRNDEGVIALQVHSDKKGFRVRFRDLSLKQYADSFGDAVRIFNDLNLDGWNAPADSKDAWTAVALERDASGKLKGFGKLSCKGSAKQPLVLAMAHGPSYVVRYQVKTDTWKTSEKAPFRDVDGWNLLEVTVRDGKASLEFNGEARADIPLPIADGKIALPSNVAADYRNVVLIPMTSK
jgi:hypothetical protein